MSICPNCKAEVDDNLIVCPECKAVLAEPAKASGSKEDEINKRIEEFNNTEDSTADFDQTDIDQNKIMAVLAYFGPLVLVPILGAPKSPFARYHSNQGLVLFIAEIVYGIIYAILSTVFYSISFSLGSILTSVLGIVYVVIAIIAIIGIINAIQGKAKALPVIGNIKILK